MLSKIPVGGFIWFTELKGLKKERKRIITQGLARVKCAKRHVP